ncbi:prophage tail fiber N-terminal domain-containing protein [Gilliamella sp. Fer4-1]|uniref:prophage tail fiber N-terminal domain-containing protein n=1 Tax=Gilliamella sp. Fer4-1 TaxID=3120242 RepID=UPI00080DC3E5|nr:prophage tail fiber N-terminal domain-containing protein [Gilliamella apicola]OCG59694.1 hypothetical protein A9G30_11460 [Gilliamella apicola]
MAKISGILTDGAGKIINNCTIELYAKRTTNKVLAQTQAFEVAENGSYTMNVLPCDYEVKLIINGFPPKKLGTIQVFSDSADGTLNDFLLNPSESEITPAVVQQVIDARNHANKSAEKAADVEKNIKKIENTTNQYAQLAKTSADNAKLSETNSENNAQSARESATTATNASAAASNSENTANSHAESARLSATASANSAAQSRNSAVLAQQSENNAKQSEQNAAKSAEDARQYASSIDSSNFIKKTGEESQSINGSLIVRESIRCDRIFNGDMIGDQRLMPFRREELPFGWYFRNGDNFLLSSPQGQALNRLSTNYKNDHNITIKTIDGQQYINVPTAFASDGRGFFERAVDGTNRQVGSAEGDAIRDIWGHFDTGVVDNHYMYSRGAFSGSNAIYPENGAFEQKKDWPAFGYDFHASNVVPTAHENRPINIGMTPVIYLGV